MHGFRWRDWIQIRLPQERWMEVEFESMKDAEVEASRLTKEMNSGNGGRYGARFSYVAVDVD